MSEKPRIVIHLGLPKTSTTYLQNGVYLLSSAINYLGKPFLNMAKRHALQARLQRTQETSVRLPPPFDAFGKYETLLRGPAILDPANEAIVAIRQQLARAVDRHKLNLLLHEGYLRPTRVNPLGFDRKVALENLKVMVGDIAEIDILITLHRRAPLMNSHTEFFWGEFVEQKFHEIPPAVALADRDGAAWRIWFEFFDFDRLVEDLHACFGPGHVHVMRYEDFLQNPATFTDVMARIDPTVNFTYPDRKILSSVPKRTLVHLTTEAEVAKRARYLAELEACDLDTFY